MGTSEARATRWDPISQIALEVILVAAMLLITVGSGVTAVARFTAREIALPVDLQAEPITSASAATLVSQEGLVRLTDPSTGQLLLASLPEVLMVLVTLVTGSLLYRVVRSLRQGDPFHRANARRLTAAALAVLVGGLLTSGASAFSSMVLAGAAQDLLGPDSGVVAGGEMSLLPALAALPIACLAEFFRRGTVLRDDVAGLV